MKNSDAGELPKKEQITFRTRRNLKNKNSIYVRTHFVSAFGTFEPIVKQSCPGNTVLLGFNDQCQNGVVSAFAPCDDSLRSKRKKKTLCDLGSSFLCQLLTQLRNGC